MKVTDILRYIRICAVKRIFYPLLFLAAAIIILLFEPLLDFFSTDTIAPDRAIASAVNAGTSFVKTSAKDLYYTGDDYYVDGTLTGHYYYELSGNYCRIYILRPAQGRPAEVYIADRAVTGKIVKSGASEETLIRDLADALQWSEEGLSSVCDPYIINEVYFFPLTSRLLFAAMLLALALGLVGFFYHLLLVFCPKLSKMYRRLKKYGRADRILSDAQSELDQDRLLDRGDLVLTPKYLFEFRAELSSIIPLESVLWVFPLQDMKYSFKDHREKMAYSLRIMTITGDTFELKDKPKEDLDKINEVLTERYPNFFYGYSEEHNRMVHYILAENKKELKAIGRKKRA